MTSPTAFHIHPVTSEADWDAARAIREQVFIVEQDCPPEDEWDAYDATSRHLLGWAGDTPVATARWRTVPYDEALAAKLERFAVLPDYRGRGYGRALVAFALDDARRAGFTTFILHAQAHLEAFYADFGFETVSGVFEEASIPHVKMVRTDAAS
ncbi:MAG: GNAT family N-acetyltransferase [Bacteroidetes bacterium]|jgi:predicted GNAT family N-acyltransferase|nr:GNAT family N-acetyltransferase [Bacteroidota bacterium]